MQDIIHVDDPRWPQLYEEQCRLRVEQERERLLRQEIAERNRHNVVINSIRRIWRELSTCEHAKTRTERVVPLTGKTDITDVKRCLSCRRVVEMAR